MIERNIIKKKEKYSPKFIIAAILWGLFTILVVTLFFAVRYLMDNWAELTAEELIFHLRSTLAGTNPEMIRGAVLRYVLPAVAVIAVLAGAVYALRDKAKYRNAFMACVLAAEFAALFMIKGELDRRIGFSDYLNWYLFNRDRDFIAENYVNPRSVEITFPQEKRNLIYIFLESAEMTYADRESGGAFEKNVIPELTELALENEDFSGEEQVLNGGYAFPGANWTVGAMFAMGTGMPLKVPINGNKITSEENFFPEMESLGTILQDQGYRQELLIGSEAVFGSRDIFYRGHGDFDIRDYTYAVNTGRIPSDYYEFWGYEDEKLFEFAREDLLEMAADGRPFNLTMLTVDTHFEDGYRCRLCRDDFGEQYADAFACSSRQVSEFIKWVQQQDFYENTTIVVCGDHLTMDRDFCQDVPEDYPRRTYVAVINGRNPDQDTWNPVFREYSTMDLFPTTLAAMNVRIEGNRLGLGTNLYSEEKTLVEEYGRDLCDSLLAMPSSFMDEMSGIKIDEELLERAKEYTRVTTEYTDDGCVVIRLYGLGLTVNYKYIDKIEVDITDRNTLKTQILEPETSFETENDVNKVYYSLKYDLNGRSVDDLEAAFYISTGEYTHFKIADVAWE